MQRAGWWIAGAAGLTALARAPSALAQEGEIAAARAGSDTERSAEPAPPPGPPAPAPVNVIVGCNAPCAVLPRQQDEFRTFGVRFSETHVKTAFERTTAVGVLAAFDHHQYTTAGLFSTRTLDFGFIGGGSAGFEGGLGGDFAFGARAPFSPTQGPFARLGLRGHLYGNDDLYSSLLELPTGQIGYQVLAGHRFLFELAASGGPVLVGRYNVDSASPRKLGESFEWGGHLALRAGGVHMELRFSRFEPERGATVDALNELGGQLCAGAWPIALCVDGRYYRGQVWTQRPGGAALNISETTYLGGHFGLLTQAPYTRERRQRHRERRFAPPPPRHF